MNFLTRDRLSWGATLGFVLVLLASVLDAVGATLPSARFLTIEPSSTWAGIARVYLEIDDLRQAGQMLEGTYQIRVPLWPSQNDTGRVQLPYTAGSIDEFGENPTTVIGSAFSSTGQVHEVVARIQPNGVVRIHVTTPDRTLHFKSKIGVKSWHDTTPVTRKR